MARLRELDRLDFKLDLAEAINVAYVGSQASKNGANRRQFLTWQRKHLRERDRLLKKSRTTIWDTMRRKSRVL